MPLADASCPPDRLLLADGTLRYPHRFTPWSTRLACRLTLTGFLCLLVLPGAPPAPTVSLAKIPASTYESSGVTTPARWPEGWVADRQEHLARLGVSRWHAAG